MRKKWIKQKLGEVFSLEYGKPLPKDRRDDKGKFPAYGANGVKCRTNDVYWNKESIVVGRKGSAGELRLVEPGFWPLDVTYYITYDEKKYDLKFLYYMLSRLNLPTFAKGVKPGINRNDVYKIEQLIPPFPEQKRIVAILDESFAEISKAVANTEKNLANVRELFESYLNEVFNHRGKRWGKKKLAGVCENLDSKRIPISKSKRIAGKIPYYGASGVVDYVKEHIFDEDLLLVSEDGANLLARTYPIAFSISGKSWVNNHAHVLRFKHIASQRFIEYYLNSISVVDFVSGMAQPKLNQKALNSIPVPWPTLEEQREVVETFDDLSRGIKQLKNIYQIKLTSLSELKQSLLQKAFSGELTAEKIKNDLQEAVA